MQKYKITTIGNTIIETERIERENTRLFVAFIMVFLAVIVAVQCLRNFVFLSVVVSGKSMNETLSTGDVLVADRLKEPSRYDVIVFNAYGVDKAVSEDGVLYIKRVVAFEGEDVWTEDGKVKYSRKNSDGTVTEYVLEDENAYYSDPNYKLSFARKTVPEGCYFVLGDNRLVSRDSRSIGFIPKENVLGVVSDFVIENKDSKILQFFIGMV